MAKTQDPKTTLRKKYMDMISDFLTQQGEECLPTANNEITLPCVDESGDETFLVLTFKIPKGSRDGDPYDGYEIAEDFKLRQEQKAEKKKKNDEQKKVDFEKKELARKKKAEKKKKREEEAAE